MTCIGATPRRSEVAENIRDLQSRTRQERRRLCRRLVLISLVLRLVRHRQPIERTVDGRDQARRHSRVACRRLQLLMSEQTRAIMLTFYVIESQSAAAPGWLLADDAVRSGRGMRPHPRL